MSSPFDALIDDFEYSEQPISDSGAWWGTFHNGPEDFLTTDEAPFGPGSVGHTNNQKGVPGLTLRVSSPGPSRNQAIALDENGLMGQMLRVCRFDFQGSGYWATYDSGGFNLNVSNNWGLTAIDSHSPIGDSVDLGFGVTCIGNKIGMWYRDIIGDVTFGVRWIQVTEIEDETFQYGHIGFGGFGGVFGFNTMTQSNCRGGPLGPRGVYINSERAPKGRTHASKNPTT